MHKKRVTGEMPSTIDVNDRLFDRKTLQRPLKLICTANILFAIFKTFNYIPYSDIYYPIFLIIYFENVTNFLLHSIGHVKDRGELWGFEN